MIGDKEIFILNPLTKEFDKLLDLFNIKCAKKVLSVLD